MNQPPKPEAQPTFKERLLKSPATFAVIGLNVAVFVVERLIGGSLDARTFLELGANKRSLVMSGQVWRLFTAIFLHADIMHLAWNSFATLDLAALVERVLGWRKFLFAWVLTGVCGNVVSAIAQDVPSVGSSGAAFGMIGIILALERIVLGSWSAWVKAPIVRRVAINLAILVAIGFLPSVRIDHFAHAGGLVSGFLLGFAFGALRRRATARRTS